MVAGFNINTQLAALYNQWEACDPGHLVRGGVVNEGSYAGSEPRITWLNKEVNDPSHTRWDLVNPQGSGFLQTEALKGLANKSFYHSVKQPGLWSYGILNGFPGLGHLKVNLSAAQGLSCVGWTNLKKSGGSGQSDEGEVAQYAQRQRDLWVRELEIMDPELIVCGFGTQYRLYGLVTRLLGQKWGNPPPVHRVPSSVTLSSYPIHHSLWQLSGHKCLIVNYANPAARGLLGTWYANLASLISYLRQQGVWC